MYTSLQLRIERMVAAGRLCRTPLREAPAQDEFALQEHLYLTGFYGKGLEMPFTTYSKVQGRMLAMLDEHGIPAAAVTDAQEYDALFSAAEALLERESRAPVISFPAPFSERVQ